MCRRYGQVPSRYLGFDAIFGDWICAEVDKHVARFGEWAEHRIAERKRTGKTWGPRYTTLGEALGIDEEARTGGRTGAERKAVAQAYNDACLAAQQAGDPMPDIVQFLKDWKDAGHA